jgi:hypothetical protein
LQSKAWPGEGARSCVKIISSQDIQLTTKKIFLIIAGLQERE